jgi:alpha-glucosidase
MPPWWRNALVYQIYPLSFQDSNGDGLGDLRGIEQRLGHVRRLGADAVWLSPIYPSPLADSGYDISDHCDVHPRFGTLEDFDRLVERAHGLGLRVLLDLVPCHTSIEHPWFREHPDWYVWSEDGPANNWISAFGGPAWSRDERSGRWYLHSFYPEQADLDWRNPEVARAIGDVVRFWLRRGVDGFRVDAVDRIWKDEALRDDPPLPAGDSPPAPFPVRPEEAGRLRVHSLLVGELYVGTGELPRYLDFFDLAFAFEFLFADWRDVSRLAQVIAAAAELERVAWVLSNHDVVRVATRLGPELVAAAAVVQLMLPGAAFVYQGDEIGMEDGPPLPRAHDRAGRDPCRRPMQWDGSPSGGFTSGQPWLRPFDPARRNVADQARDPRSLLNLYRRLSELRRSPGKGFELLQMEGGLLSFRHGRHLVSANLGREPLRVEPRGGEIVLSTAPQASGAELGPGEARVEELR